MIGCSASGGSSLDLAMRTDAPPGGSGPMIAGCPVFPVPADSRTPTGLLDEWNRDVSSDPIDPMSDTYIASMNGATKKLHPDFGSDPSYGIPWITVPGSQPTVPMVFGYADESDPGPYPFPADAPVEGGPSATGDRHVLVVDRDRCVLYETFDSHFIGPGWNCGSGARWDMRSTARRPAGWTSADAAGLPILPGLVRRDEARAGEIRHAFRFTAARTRRAYVDPATHFASSSTDPNLPPMGLRVRLKASYDLSRFAGLSRAILEALRRYGMILADNGSDWFITGETNTSWEDADLEQLKTVPASAFEAVRLGALHQ